MPEENKWSTRNFDLAKGGVLLVILLLLAVAYFLAPAGTAEQPSAALPPPTDSPAPTQPVASVPVVEQPSAEPDGTVTLSGSAEPGSTVELWAGDAKLAVVTVDADGEWVYTGQLPPGQYEVVARTVNPQGQVVSESEAVVLQVGESTPEAMAAVVQILSIAVEPGGAVTVSGLADQAATVEIWQVETRLASVPVAGDGNWSAVLQLQAGDYRITARSLDDAGGILDESQAVAISVTGVASVSINQPQVDPSGEISITGTGEPGSIVEIVDGGEVVATATVESDGTWQASFQSSPGGHNLSVQVQNQAGEAVSAASVTVTVPESTGGFSYIVKRGDWLRQLARKFYGDPLRWVDIYNATNAKAAVDHSYHVIVNPNLIRPGWKIWIPEL